MKTLYEVIAELEDEGLFADALHYLKEYRMLKDDIAEKRKKLESEIARYHEAEQDALKALDDWASRGLEENKKLALTEDNPPLTWKQLKQMEGKPVWVEQHHGDTKGWLLILRKCDDVVTCTTKHGNSFYLYKANYGEKWQAYRKERTE